MQPVCALLMSLGGADAEQLPLASKIRPFCAEKHCRQDAVVVEVDEGHEGLRYVCHDHVVDWTP